MDRLDGLETPREVTSKEVDIIKFLEITHAVLPIEESRSLNHWRFETSKRLGHDVIALISICCSTEADRLTGQLMANGAVLRGSNCLVSNVHYCTVPLCFPLGSPQHPKVPPQGPAHALPL